MARTGRRREWGPTFWALGPTPRAREKGAGKSEPPRPYREPTQVPWVRSLRRTGLRRARELGQVGPVTSGEGVPAALGVEPWGRRSQCLGGPDCLIKT